MTEELFVIGDVHGEISLLRKLLEYWHPETQQLLFLGDLGDRGENPREVFLLVQELSETYGAICILGNHEDILLNFLNDPVYYAANYYLNGGWNTLQTLLEDVDLQELEPPAMAALIKKRYPELIAYLKSLPLYYEWNQYVCVHAGIDLTKKDWRKTKPRDFVWIREPFHEGKNRTGKVIVFGHTPTFMLHGDMENSDIWIKDNKIGMDGGAVFGGTLHGIVFDKKGMKQHYGVSKEKDDESITANYFYKRED